MAHYDLKTQDLKAFAPKLRAGDTVTLTGTLYTARDAAHKRIVAAMDEGQDLPFDLDGAAVYYAGPTPEKPGQADAMARNGAVYMVAIGGAGAVKAESVKALDVIAYEDLGCESVKRLTVEEFTAIVAMDSAGGNLYRDGAAQYRTE